MDAKKHSRRRKIAATHKLPTALDTYLDELRAHPLLAPSEEAEVAGRARAGDEEAINRLVRGNLRFAVSVAMKYKNRGLDLADLIAEGNAGLLTAAGKFDPEQGVRFISYAVWWVQQAILKALAEQGRSVRVPLNRATDLAAVKRAGNHLLQRLEREPTEHELAEETGLSVEIVRGLHRLSLADERTDADEDKDAKQTRELADEGSGALQQLLEAEHSEVLARALQRLPPRLGAVLRLRFGLGGGSERTLDESGRMLGVSGERVRQLSEEALGLLRADCELARDADREPTPVPVRRRRGRGAKRTRRTQAVA